MVGRALGYGNSFRNVHFAKISTPVEVQEHKLFLCGYIKIPSFQGRTVCKVGKRLAWEQSKLI